MLEFRTQGFQPYSVAYSPFFDSRIGVAAAANYGLVGNGRLYVLRLTPQGSIVPESTPTASSNTITTSSPANGLGPAAQATPSPPWFDTQDALYDLAWSEAHENQCVVAGGDGSVRMFDVGLHMDTPGRFPIQVWQEHKREVYAVNWNMVEKTTFVSSSWDGTVKIWSPARPTSLLTLPTHSCTYSAAFSPHHPSLVSAVSSDSHLRLFDLRTPASAANHLTSSIPIHNGATGAANPLYQAQTGATQPAEALTHDWNKYRDTVIATAGVDTLIRTFDIRQGSQPAHGPSGALLNVLSGHKFAVRRVAWSPHVPDMLLSASYDMTCGIWSDGFNNTTSNAIRNGNYVKGEIGRMGRHTEFVTGVDWCLFGSQGWAASCGWDERLCVWDVRGFLGGGVNIPGGIL